MHIKKLEIAGFKSFVDRTTIHFDHDVIGIVGPNGCGKSNIVDAIRWCMGEQSAKHLRGRSMEDVIFNGSDSRAQAGLAEVTLTFDNTNPEYADTLPLEYKDFPEIAVTRRLFRDGTSEYQLNRTTVRLRDITDLFLGTGVGTKAYSIVEQGRIGQIVSARPEDRRLFIEEAAGITKYKHRRHQAERKMELTRQNLARVSDIIAEIDRTRVSLKRQVAKAERFLVYREELEDLVLHDASHRLLELIVTEKVDRAALEHAESSSLVLREQLKAAELLLEELRKSAMDTEVLADDGARRAFHADNEVSGLQAEMDRARDKLSHLNDRLEAAEAELSEILPKLAELRAEHAELLQRAESLGADESARQADAQAENEKLDALRSDETGANQTVQNLRREVAEATNNTTAAEVRLDGLVQRIAETHIRRDKLSTEHQSVLGEQNEFEARRHALEQSVAETAEGKRLTFAEQESLEKEVNVLRGQLLDSERAVDSRKNELSLRRNRLRALEELHRRLEGVGAGARALLGKADPEVLGMVADRIEAPEELTLAFASLLGERLQYIVVSDLEHGLHLLDDLRENQRGRATVVAARPGYIAGGARAFSDEPGVLGSLADQLRYEAADEALVRAIVGDAVLVTSSEHAVQFVARHPDFTAVALDGTVARPSGVVSGGGGDEVASAMVEQKREMHSLTTEVSRLEAEYQKLFESHNALRGRITAAETSLDRARKGAHEGELAHVSAEKDLVRTNGELERLRTRHAAIAAELAELESVITRTTLEEQASREQLDVLRALLEQAQSALAKAEARAQSWKEQAEAQAQLVTDRKVRLAQVREQVEATRISASRVEATIGELVTRSNRLKEDMEEAARSYGETAAVLLLSRENRITALEAARVAHQYLNEIRTQLEQARHALTEHEASLKQVREELSLLDEASRKHEMSVQRNELSREHLLQNIRERFRGLDLNRVVGTYHMRSAPDEEHHRRIDELTKLIDRMGPVNLDAKAEHDDAESRFVSLSAQKEDIERALIDLDRAIKHMNRESKKRFQEAFDSINALFRATFSRMFRGGRGELLLTNPDDMLATGVDIMAQPPGKKLGNIELMSGGEKALTAVSLIFAIFQHKPSPFCILDEVDAPLDEANVSRYNEAIRSMTERSQFILITHIKQTMQSVDVLYGVTMGEPGVSKLVSVKVNEGVQARSETLAPRVRDNLLKGSPVDTLAPESSDGDEVQVA
ncbi:MAG: chromosome segregation protein SMC [Polyangiaceae bacterium]|nr:chromosome segregation protein SMC [Polyangiaceae bacterium]